MSNFNTINDDAVDFYDQFRRSELDFNLRDYRGAITRLKTLIAGLGDTASDQRGLSSARELLARSYFHAAQLGPAEVEVRQLLADDPTDAYAALLLARTLQRQSRHEEADRALRLAAALGAPDVDVAAAPRYDVQSGFESATS